MDACHAASSRAASGARVICRGADPAPPRSAPSRSSPILETSARQSTASPRHGDLPLSWRHRGRGQRAAAHGRLEEARNLPDDPEAACVPAIAIQEGAGDKAGLPASLNSLAGLVFDNGDVEKAREVRACATEACALGLWGEIAELEGARSEAITFYRDAMTICDQISMPKNASHALPRHAEAPRRDASS